MPLLTHPPHRYLFDDEIPRFVVLCERQVQLKDMSAAEGSLNQIHQLSVNIVLYKIVLRDFRWLKRHITVGSRLEIISLRKGLLLLPI